MRTLVTTLLFASALASVYCGSGIVRHLWAQRRRHDAVFAAYMVFIVVLTFAAQAVGAFVGGER